MAQTDNSEKSQKLVDCNCLLPAMEKGNTEKSRNPPSEKPAKGFDSTLKLSCNGMLRRKANPDEHNAAVEISCENVLSSPPESTNFCKMKGYCNIHVKVGKKFFVPFEVKGTECSKSSRNFKAMTKSDFSSSLTKGDWNKKKRPQKEFMGTAKFTCQVNMDTEKNGNSSFRSRNRRPTSINPSRAHSIEDSGLKSYSRKAYAAEYEKDKYISYRRAMWPPTSTNVSTSSTHITGEMLPTNAYTTEMLMSLNHLREKRSKPILRLSSTLCLCAKLINHDIAQGKTEVLMTHVLRRLRYKSRKTIFYTAKRHKRELEVAKSFSVEQRKDFFDSSLSDMGCHLIVSGNIFPSRYWCVVLANPKQH